MIWCDKDAIEDFLLCEKQEQAVKKKWRREREKELYMCYRCVQSTVGSVPPRIIMRGVKIGR